MKLNDSGTGDDPFYLERGDVRVIAAKVVGGSGANVTASLTWRED
jgi:hypothetical protein